VDVDSLVAALADKRLRSEAIRALVGGVTATELRLSSCPTTVPSEYTVPSE
jgi:hypothetical protein